jgi:molecular chaperone GrpE
MTGENKGHDQTASSPSAPGRHADPGQTPSPHAEGQEAAASGADAPSPQGDNPVAQQESEVASLKDRLLRALAEVENVRRRAERDVSDARQFAISNFARDMISVADNLQRAVSSVPQGAADSAGALKTLVEGVGLTEKEMLRSFERHGVKKLDPVGERFDPNYHEAMFEVPDAKTPAGHVTQVISPGYAIGTRALRPAKVGVSSGTGPSGA